MGWARVGDGVGAVVSFGGEGWGGGVEWGGEVEVVQGEHDGVGASHRLSDDIQHVEPLLNCTPHSGEPVAQVQPNDSL